MHGSKALIETLHSHGFCASYHEVRRYLTSLACSELSQVQNNTYIPSGIRQYNGTVSVIHEGADNVDINAETIDGKDTFHSMARAVFQVCEEINGETEHLEHQKVARGRIKTLPIDEKVFSLTTCASFTKPKQRAEPSRKNDVIQSFLRVYFPMLKPLTLSGCSLEIYQGLLLTFHTNNLRLKDNKFHSGLDSTSRSRILVPLIMLLVIRQSLTQNLPTWALCIQQ